MHHFIPSVSYLLFVLLFSFPLLFQVVLQIWSLGT